MAIVGAKKKNPPKDKILNFLKKNRHVWYTSRFISKSTGVSWLPTVTILRFLVNSGHLKREDGEKQFHTDEHGEVYIEQVYQYSPIIKDK